MRRDIEKIAPIKPFSPLPNYIYFLIPLKIQTCNIPLLLKLIMDNNLNLVKFSYRANEIKIFFPISHTYCFFCLDWKTGKHWQEKLDFQRQIADPLVSFLSGDSEPI